NRWQTTRFDALTTDDHRWLMHGPGHKPGGHFSSRLTLRKHHFATTAEVNQASGTKGGHKYFWAGGGSPVTQAQKAMYSAGCVELVGWYRAEGSPSPPCQAVIIGPATERKPYAIAALRRLQRHYRSSGATATECKPQDNGWGPIAQFYFGKGIGGLVPEACPDKTFTPEFLQRLTAGQLRLLYETMMAGDGTRHKNGGTPVFAQK